MVGILLLQVYQHQQRQMTMLKANLTSSFQCVRMDGVFAKATVYLSSKPLSVRISAPESSSSLLPSLLNFEINQSSRFVKILC